ncbi:methyltransferase domain-containing protein [Altererythrobacter xixiisoli]|uniref:Methyltransferase domain-containing protein n=1 Tax=Croceibacterium xixiisoli TaxID=1476466 RepID=A0A6I4TWQ9_9SPHN|nr:class I SAM-dependent methyltransferase [Croceibacterium xixiisoli]MXP00616.1 methyltransferase domain-containing protein [Croceibacterium xixiisoli]
MDGYAVTGQFHDPLAAQAHAEVDARIAQAIAPLGPLGGPVLDIGAGTGLTTALIARTLTEAEIFAIEPDATMRAALMTRIWHDPDLRRRVSILPMDALSAPLPDRIAGAVLSASLVHFSPAERAQLWAALAGRLVPGGRIVAELQAQQAIDIPPAAMATAQVGRITYSGTAAAQALPGNRQRWTMTYRSEYAGRVMREEQASYVCWCVDQDSISREARAAGLQSAPCGELMILSRAT